MIYAITRPDNPDAIAEMGNPAVAIVQPMAHTSVGDVHSMIARAWEQAVGDESVLVSILQGQGFEVIGFNEVELTEIGDIEDGDNVGDDL